MPQICLRVTFVTLHQSHFTKSAAQWEEENSAIPSDKHIVSKPLICCSPATEGLIKFVSQQQQPTRHVPINIITRLSLNYLHIRM